MARGMKTGGKDFKPGQMPGPGRPPAPPELKEARKLNQIDFELLVNKFLRMNKEDIQEVLRSNTSTTLELMIAGIISRGVTGGDQNRLEFILSRLFGKPKERHEITGLDGNPLRAQIALMSDEDISKELYELAAKSIITGKNPSS